MINIISVCVHEVLSFNKPHIIVPELTETDSGSLNAAVGAVVQPPLLHQRLATQPPFTFSSPSSSSSSLRSYHIISSKSSPTVPHRASYRSIVPHEQYSYQMRGEAQTQRNWWNLLFYTVQRDHEEEPLRPSQTKTLPSPVVLGAAGLHEGQRIHSALLQGQLALQTSPLQPLSLAQRNHKCLDVIDKIPSFSLLSPFFSCLTNVLLSGLLLFQPFHWVFTVSWLDSRQFDEASCGGSLATPIQVIHSTTVFCFCFCSFFVFLGLWQKQTMSFCRVTENKKSSCPLSVVIQQFLSHVKETTCQHVAGTSCWLKFRINKLNLGI